MSSSGYFVVVEQQFFELGSIFGILEEAVDFDPFFGETTDQAILIDWMGKVVLVGGRTAF